MPGRIQCSKVSASILLNRVVISSNNDPFKVVRRGELNIKGKGEMTLYWIRAQGDSELFDEEEECSVLDMSQTSILRSSEMLEPIMEDYPSPLVNSRRLSGSLRDGLRRSLKFVNAQSIWTHASDKDVTSERTGSF